MLTPEWISAISTVVLVIATLVYVFYTSKLVKETVKLREVETTPFVSIYIKPTRPIKMYIKNIGKAPAYNISIEMEEKYKECFLLNCFNNKNKINYISPNQHLIYLMNQYHLLINLEYSYIPITVKYTSKDGKEFIEVFNINWKDMISTQFESNKLEDIKIEIEKVSKEIKNLSETINKKEHFITNKLKILEFDKNESNIKIIFSNGIIYHNTIDNFLDKMNINEKKGDNLYLNNGNLYNYQEGLEYLSEEVYFNVVEANK